MSGTRLYRAWEVRTRYERGRRGAYAHARHVHGLAVEQAKAYRERHWRAFAHVAELQLPLFPLPPSVEVRPVAKPPCPPEPEPTQEAHG